MALTLLETPAAVHPIGLRPDVVSGGRDLHRQWPHLDSDCEPRDWSGWTVAEAHVTDLEGAVVRDLTAFFSLPSAGVLRAEIPAADMLAAVGQHFYHVALVNGSSEVVQVQEGRWVVAPERL